MPLTLLSNGGRNPAPPVIYETPFKACDILHTSTGAQQYEKGRPPIPRPKHLKKDLSLDET